MPLSWKLSAGYAEMLSPNIARQSSLVPPPEAALDTQPSLVCREALFCLDKADGCAERLMP